MIVEKLYGLINKNFSSSFGDQSAKSVLDQEKAEFFKKSQEQVQNNLKELVNILPDQVIIENPECYVHVVSFLQENWALLITDNDGTSARIYFCYGKRLPSDDYASIFDTMVFENKKLARKELEHNVFHNWDKMLKELGSSQLDSFPPLPPAEYSLFSHPSGLIYSSGIHWQRFT